MGYKVLSLILRYIERVFLKNDVKLNISIKLIFFVIYCILLGKSMGKWFIKYSMILKWF